VTHARHCASTAIVVKPVEDPTPLLETSWTASDGPRSLRVSGELDIATAPVPAAALDGEIRPGSRLRLDVDDLVFVDAAGLRVLVGVRRTAGLTGRVVLRHPCPRVQRVIALTGLDGVDGFDQCLEASPAEAPLSFPVVNSLAFRDGGRV
jgi:anti-anti-sigma factor